LKSINFSSVSSASSINHYRKIAEFDNTCEYITLNEFLCKFFEQHIKTNVVSKLLARARISDIDVDRHYVSDSGTKFLISIMVSRLWF